MTAADLGIVGLGVMGANLALNFADHGYRVAVWNRTSERTREFLAGPAAGTTIVGTDTLPELVGVLRTPRVVLLMVPAGRPVDAQLDALTPLLDPGDVIIDGGNSHHRDTARRCDRLAEAGLRFVGMGVSGGADGARHGPSLMPGGHPEAWPLVETMLEDVAAKADDGTPCCEWLGPGGVGHYVKMVHNGIEYGDMQVIAEAYDLLRRGVGMTVDEARAVFGRWRTGKLASFLVDLTVTVLGVTDDDGTPLVDRILDVAEQKGTGRWTVVASMEEAEPVSLIAEAVYARFVSARREDRLVAAERLAGPEGSTVPASVVDDLHDALHAARIVSYAQGFMLLASASDAYGWDLDLATVASLWRAGCIIRSRLLGDIMAAFADDPELPSLVLDPGVADELRRAGPGWRRVVAAAVAAGIPVPAMASALGFYDAYRSARLPANLIQAQRDAFGAHTYERIDRPRGEAFHTDWLADAP
ncbi:MAG TPA: decarboxylating NADP(+)-dependent phosphogluconate dehydrogenase [Actinobacteria bacterium]|nr:decarboxylating NADP(+)-dependent phosphogluconate dehydrogenase [Actinomycetota bacterium]